MFTTDFTLQGIFSKVGNLILFHILFRQFLGLNVVPKIYFYFLFEEKKHSKRFDRFELNSIQEILPSDNNNNT